MAGRFIEVPAYHFGGIASCNGIWRNVASHHRAACHHRAVPYRYSGQDRCVGAEPYVVAYHYVATSATEILVMACFRQIGWKRIATDPVDPVLA